jgi:hypothetical protein
MVFYEIHLEKSGKITEIFVGLKKSLYVVVSDKSQQYKMYEYIFGSLSSMLIEFWYLQVVIRECIQYMWSCTT